MESLKHAYEKLGVNEGASKEEIENRYFLLIRRHQSRMKELPEGEKAEEEAGFEEINQAYRQLKEYLQRQSLESNPIYLAEQKKSPFRRKTEHFLHYYKMHIIGSLIAVVLVTSLIYSIATKEKELPSDLATMMVGAYYAQDLAALETRMTAYVPEWERIAVDINFTPNESMNQFDVAQLEKSMVVLATERPDIYIVDTYQFDRLGPQGIFHSLEPWKEELSAFVGEEQLVYGQFEGDAEPVLYGIDFTESEVFTEFSSDTNAKIFTISSNQNETEGAEKSLQLIRAIAAE